MLLENLDADTIIFDLICTTIVPQQPKEAKKLLQGLVQDDIRLFAALYGTRSISQAIDAIGTSAGNSSNLFWEQKEVLSISHVARCYSILLSRAGAGVQEFQVSVTPAEIKTAVVKLLDTAVPKGFNIEHRHRALKAFVHEHATLVDMRNEQAGWTALLASRNDVSLDALRSSSVNFFGGTGCSSLEAATLNSTKPTSPSLFDKLAARPGLWTLQLSLIPYIDLANGVMESFVKNVGSLVPPSPVPIQGFSMTDQGIYHDQIAAQTFPLTVFLTARRSISSASSSHLSTHGSQRWWALFDSESRLFLAAKDRVTPPDPYFLRIAKSVLESASSIVPPNFFKAIYDLSIPAYAVQGERGEAAVRKGPVAPPGVHDGRALELLRGRDSPGPARARGPDWSPTFSGKLEDLRLRYLTKDKAFAVVHPALAQDLVGRCKISTALSFFGAGDAMNGMSVVAQTVTTMAAGLMDTNRDKSRCARLFLKGKTGADASLKANHTPLLMICRPTEEGFSATVAAVKIDNNKLDLAKVTAMYHISVFCHIPAMELAHFEAFQALWIRTIPLLLACVSSPATKKPCVRGCRLGALAPASGMRRVGNHGQHQSSKEALPAVDKDNTTPSPSDAAAALAELFDPLAARLTTAFIERKFTRLQPSRNDENKERDSAHEETLNARRVFFLQHIIGPLQTRLARQVSNPKAHTGYLLDILRVLAASNEIALGKDSSDVFFSLTSADFALIFDKGAGGWTSNQLRLQNGQVYSLRAPTAADTLLCRPNCDAVRRTRICPSHFLTPLRITDPYGFSFARIELDSHLLTFKSSTDALGNVPSYVHSYHIMKLVLETDPNGNRSAYKYGCLKRLIASSVTEKANEQISDSLQDIHQSWQSTKEQILPWTPRTLCRSAQGRYGPLHLRSRVVFQGKRGITPIYATSLSRVTHVHKIAEGSKTKIIIFFSHFDGLGRAIQTKAIAELLNNKGKMPCSSSTPFSTARTLSRSTIEPASAMPNNTWSKVMYSSWATKTFDANDTMLMDPKHDTDVGGYFSRLADSEYLPIERLEKRQSDGNVFLLTKDGDEEFTAYRVFDGCERAITRDARRKGSPS
ncbi:uncharacterized protein ATNIH1004_011731 [Aspergillus tanneri]|uniref:Uncharacterized protein n=1 Tax=Aspergillus tanneri TaxID=1220188 RepID=A0A5M9M3N4_9EURO|nr:uncharacterized protein ATNIH1004_011731 [Aspergillus tanneri]KAA8641595.1 hypothetical protein ATNIH1004_011731 [Aspergillus tanneri]